MQPTSSDGIEPVPRTQTPPLSSPQSLHDPGRPACARDGEDDRDVLERIFRRKDRLSREEGVGISAFAPLFAQGLYGLTRRPAP